MAARGAHDSTKPPPGTAKPGSPRPRCPRRWSSRCCVLTLSSKVRPLPCHAMPCRAHVHGHRPHPPFACLDGARAPRRASCMAIAQIRARAGCAAAGRRGPLRARAAPWHHRIGADYPGTTPQGHATPRHATPQRMLIHVCCRSNQLAGAGVRARACACALRGRRRSYARVHRAHPDTHGGQRQWGFGRHRGRWRPGPARRARTCRRRHLRGPASVRGRVRAPRGRAVLGGGPHVREGQVREPSSGKPARRRPIPLYYPKPPCKRGVPCHR